MSGGMIERCFRAVRSRANFGRAQEPRLCLALALFCVESKAIKIGKDFAGRTAADTHVYSRRASGGRPPRRPGRLEKSQDDSTDWAPSGGRAAAPGSAQPARRRPVRSTRNRDPVNFCVEINQ